MDLEGVRDRIRDSTNIVDLVQEVISLKPAGKEYLGLCPFHDDQRPSMHVNPVKQIYKCFSCGAGGDVFAWVMNYNKMTFPEALSFLGDKAGIQVHRAKPNREREEIYAALETAVSFYQRSLAQSEEARTYLEKQRKFTPDTIAKFRLGYSPDRWDSLAKALQSKFDPKILVMAGLIKERKFDQGFYDVFRHRVMFPISDSLGRIIGFGGRVLRKEDEPKYLNTSETQVFDKGAVIYGLNLALREATKKREIILFEGYTDVVHAHQSGFENTGAVIGAAVTDKHLAILARRLQGIRKVFCFDSDTAGQNAALKTAEAVLGSGGENEISILPIGEDPADVLERGGNLEAIIKTSRQSAFNYIVSQRTNSQDLKNPETVSRILSTISLPFSKIPDNLRPAAIEIVAKRLGISRQSIELAFRTSEQTQISQAFADQYEESLVQDLLVSDIRTFNYISTLVDHSHLQNPLAIEVFHYLALRAQALKDENPGLFADTTKMDNLTTSGLPLFGQDRLQDLIRYIQTEAYERRGLLISGQRIRDLERIFLRVPKTKPSSQKIEHSALMVRTYHFQREIDRASIEGRSKPIDLIRLLSQAQREIGK